MHRLTRRELFHAGAVAVGAVAVPLRARDGAGRIDQPQAGFSFHFDHVLGTSLDGWLNVADAGAARRAEQGVLDEIERLRRVFSPFDPQSELSQLNRSTGAVHASGDLLAVLREYESWIRLSAGACNAQLGGLVRLWAEAERSGVLPDERTVADLARRISSPAWRIEGDRVVRLSDQPLNLNSIAKGYILNRAAAAARTIARDGLLNLGGDLCHWGEPAAVVGVQDPASPAENARPLTALKLTDAAVATSGGYERYYTLGGQRFSHLIDPRTGRPAGGVCATVVAPTSVTANALATILCVQPVAQGLRLVDELSGVECLLIQPDGSQIRSRGFAALEVALADDAPKKDDKEKKAEAWPADHQVSIALDLPQISATKRYRRPYVAVWIEGADSKPVRNVVVWGNASRWLPTLTGWWKVAREDKALIKAVTRATRAPGKYTVVWDGKDDQGKPVAQGTYTVRIEVHREHGRHLFQTAKIDCLAEPAKVTAEKNAESGEVVIQYGKRK